MAAPSARNTSVGATSHTAKDTRGGRSALVSLGSGVTLNAPSKRHEQSALSQTAFSAVASFTLVSVIVTGRIAPAPIPALMPAADASAAIYAISRGASAAATASRSTSAMNLSATLANRTIVRPSTPGGSGGSGRSGG